MRLPGTEGDGVALTSTPTKAEDLAAADEMRKKDPPARERMIRKYSELKQSLPLQIVNGHIEN